MEKATFGAGCFWGVEATFRRVAGVVEAAVGYEGGTLDNPTYEDVCTDKTGHAEVVEIVFDPTKVSYEELLEVFWENHNPTTLNRQRPLADRQQPDVFRQPLDHIRRVSVPVPAPIPSQHARPRLRRMNTPGNQVIHLGDDLPIRTLPASWTIPLPPMRSTTREILRGGDGKHPGQFRNPLKNVCQTLPQPIPHRRL